MIKKIFGLICILVLIFTLVGCSNEPIPAQEPAATYNVGETVHMNSTSFVIHESWRVSAEVDKRHVVYGIHVNISNHGATEIPFNVSSIACYAGNELCENYTGFDDALANTIILPESEIDGWIYFKIPDRHDGLSFSYTYDNEGNYILFIFEEG